MALVIMKWLLITNSTLKIIIKYKVKIEQNLWKIKKCILFWFLFMFYILLNLFSSSIWMKYLSKQLSYQSPGQENVVRRSHVLAQFGLQSVQQFFSGFISWTMPLYLILFWIITFTNYNWYSLYIWLSFDLCCLCY
jgi:hypothetical protein